MVQETYTGYIRKVLQNKQKLESELDIKITNKGKLVFVEGDADDEFIALQVIEAINLGFSPGKALLLKNEEIILNKIHIKDLTKRQDLERIRARIIGTKGKTLKTLNTLTNCHFSLRDNDVGIIGNCEEVEEAIQAVTSLIQGSKQGNVYAHAEKARKRKRQEWK